MALPSFSNLVHKFQMEVALFNQLKAGFKEANRHRVPLNVQANNTGVVVLIAPFDGTVEGVLAASPSGATTSSNGNSVTISVVDNNGGGTLASFDTFVNKTELAVNTGAAFFVPGLALSNGTPAPSFKAGDVLALKVLVTGTPGITSANSLNLQLVVVPTDPKAAF